MSRADHAVPFYEKEQKCEHLFRSEGPFWHLYTDGSKTDMLFAETVWGYAQADFRMYTSTHSH